MAAKTSGKMAIFQKSTILHQRTPYKMNGRVLSVKFSETLGFASSKRVEQMSQWALRPAMDRF